LKEYVGGAPIPRAHAFAPGHITGVFEIHDQPTDLLSRGSRGAGVSIERGVSTKVLIERSLKPTCEIKINGEPQESADVSVHVLHSFLSRSKENYRILVEHDVQVPIGSGFGSSGSGALSLAFALNQALGLRLSRVEVAQIAHVAEVHCKTGLGTVIGETYGGVEIRVKPGAPGVGEITHIPITQHAVVCLHFGPISTAHILSDPKIRQRINDFGGRLVDKLLAHPTACNFMAYSREFAEYVGLMTERMWDVLKDADHLGFTCSMMMLGESIFSLVKRDRVAELLDIFRQHAPSEQSIIVSDIDFQGARLL
jgi:pantoate kinase